MAQRSSRVNKAPGALARGASLAVALCAAALLAAEFLLRPTVLDAWLFLLTVYGALLLWRPALFLFVLPAMLPIASLAQWTGSMYAEEWDLFALLTAILLYTKLALRPTPVAKPGSPHGIGTVLLGLMALSYALSMWRGLVPIPEMDINALTDYHSYWNSLRIGKGFFYAALLWPLMRRYLCEGEARDSNLFAAGVATTLGLVSLLCLWERVAFPGLLNMSSDYRSTALFWEMHVGGAALDGFLALSFPFAIWAMLRARKLWATVFAIALFALATYAIFTTFSRALYAAYVLSLAIALWRGLRSVPAEKNWFGSIALFSACVPLVFVFLSSGYRGLIAACGLLIAGLAASHIWRASTAKARIRALLFAPVTIAFATAMYLLLPKGAYLAYGAFFIAMALLYMGYLRGASSVSALTLAIFVALPLSALFVAFHWSGKTALLDMGVAVVAAFALAAINVAPLNPPLPNTRGTWLTLSVALTIAGLVAVTAHSFYVAERFSTVNEDLQGRAQHWRLGLSGLRGWGDWLLGKGLGRFPATYFWNVPSEDRPGVHQLERLNGDTSLVLNSPNHMLGYGAIYRIGQEVAQDPKAPIIVSMDVQADREVSALVEVCQKHLLYNGPCFYGDARAKALPGEWQNLKFRLVGTLPDQVFYAPRLCFFSIGIQKRGLSMRIDNLSVVDGEGRELLRNGDFSEGPAYWFFTSDRHHLPWHMKNLWLNYLFDQGWLGILAFSLALGGAAGRVLFGRARRHPLAPYLLASLVGFAVVGLFDSLVDVPRLSFLFFLLVFAGLFLDPPPDLNSRTKSQAV